MKRKLNKITSKLYPDLNPQKRFELAMRYLARGDDSEAGLVANSCKKVIYRELDCKFTNRIDAADNLVMAITTILREIVAQLNVIEGFVKAQGKTPFSDRFSMVILKDLKSFWDGFSDFCIEFLHLESEVLLKAFNSPILDELERIQEATSKMPEIEADRERVKEMFVNGWRARVR